MRADKISKTAAYAIHFHNELLKTEVMKMTYLQELYVYLIICRNKYVILKNNRIEKSKLLKKLKIPINGKIAHVYRF